MVAEFAEAARPPKVKDRRAEPVAGYRAVHVIANVQDVPVEIQIRTIRQDQWAQVVESLGDKWGRGIRYGDPPPDDPADPAISRARRQFWDLLLEGSATIAEVEALPQRDQYMLDAMLRITRAYLKFAQSVQ